MRRKGDADRFVYARRKSLTPTLPRPKVSWAIGSPSHEPIPSFLAPASSPVMLCLWNDSAFALMALSSVSPTRCSKGCRYLSPKGPAKSSRRASTFFISIRTCANSRANNWRIKGLIRQPEDWRFSSAGCWLNRDGAWCDVVLNAGFVGEGGGGRPSVMRSGGVRDPRRARRSEPSTSVPNWQKGSSGRRLNQKYRIRWRLRIPGECGLHPGRS